LPTFHFPVSGFPVFGKQVSSLGRLTSGSRAYSPLPMVNRNQILIVLAALAVAAFAVFRHRPEDSSAQSGTWEPV